MLLTLFSLSLHAYGQGTFIYDQQSADESTGGGAGYFIQTNQPIGQSFTPNLSSVGFVRLFLWDRANGLGATLSVNLWSGSLTNGSLLGTTLPVALPDQFLGYTDFFFANPVAVTPGETVYFQPTIQSGDTTVNIFAYHYGYPGGTSFIQGVPNPNGFDLWFREGIVVPEPSAFSLLIGSGVLLYVHRKKNPKHTVR